MFLDRFIKQRYRVTFGISTLGHSGAHLVESVYVYAESQDEAFDKAKDEIEKKYKDIIWPDSRVINISEE